jgi:hypothetical protein
MDFDLEHILVTTRNEIRFKYIEINIRILIIWDFKSIHGLQNVEFFPFPNEFYEFRIVKSNDKMVEYQFKH